MLSVRTMSDLGAGYGLQPAQPHLTLRVTLRRRVTLAVGVIVSATSPSAWAQEPPLESIFSDHQLELAPSGHFGIRFTNDCRSGGGTATCGNVSILFVQFAARWRATPYWAFGGFGATSFGGESASHSQSWYRLEAEARWHPFGAPSTDPWLGIEGGLVHAVNELGSTEFRPAATYQDSAPVLGVAGGIDWLVDDVVALGPELRGFWMLFGEQSDGRYRPSRQFAVTLGFAVTVVLAPRGS
jgi:hypothetical protein